MRLEPGELSCVRQRESNEESVFAAATGCGWRESRPTDCAESARRTQRAHVVVCRRCPPCDRQGRYGGYGHDPSCKTKNRPHGKASLSIKNNDVIINYALAHVNNMHLKKCVQKSMILARFARKIDAGERFQRTPDAESVTVGNTESLNLAHPSGTNRKVSSGAAE